MLPKLRDEFVLDEGDAGNLIAFANLGTVAAFVLVRASDRIGRRGVLQITIIGYCVASLLSAAAPTAPALAVCQFFARLFLIGEWGVAMVIAAEEFPAERRGLVLGLIQAASALGAILCAAVVPFIAAGPLGWRGVFLVSVVPLMLIAVLRRSMRETQRFAAASARAGSSMMRLIRGPYRYRILELALAWSLTYACTQAGVTFFKEFAVHERHLDERTVGGMLAIAAVLALPPLFLMGRALDRFGRRLGGLVMYLALILGVLGAYATDDIRVQTIALALGVFGSSAVLPVLNAYTTERFPTEVRGDAYAWTNNLLGRTGYVLGPLFVGHAAKTTGWGPAVAVTVIGPVLAIALLLWRMPETRGQELEETSRL